MKRSFGPVLAFTFALPTEARADIDVYYASPTGIRLAKANSPRLIAAHYLFRAECVNVIREVAHAPNQVSCKRCALLDLLLLYPALQSSRALPAAHASPSSAASRKVRNRSGAAGRDDLYADHR